MKITFILPALNLNGGTRVAAIYADRLAARGHDVMVVAPRQKPPTLRRRVSSMVKKRRWLSYSPYDDTYFRSSRARIEILNADTAVTDTDVPDADIVIATWWKTAEWVNSLSSAKGLKFLFIQGYEIRDDVPAGLTDRLKATWRLPLHKIVISEWLQEIARETFDTEPVALVPNGVDPVQFHAPPRRRQPIPTVGLMYSSLPFKGIDISLKAIAIARRKRPNLKVMAFGTTQPVPSLSLPKDTIYRRRPPQEDIREIYAGCDAWLFPSRNEGFGLPILEAMACRTPVVATPAGAAPELLAEGGGILVRPEDPQDMADAIENLFSMTDDQWQDLSDKAFATARRYSWADAANKFEAALCSVLKKSSWEGSSDA